MASLWCRATFSRRKPSMQQPSGPYLLTCIIPVSYRSSMRHPVFWRKFVRPRFMILFVLLAVALNACGGGTPVATSTPVPTDTPIVPPTLTATPTIPLAILILPADLNKDTSDLYQ